METTHTGPVEVKEQVLLTLTQVYYRETTIREYYDLHLISPNNIIPELHIKVPIIKEMITN